MLISIDEPPAGTINRFGGTAAAPVFARLVPTIAHELESSRPTAVRRAPGDVVMLQRGTLVVDDAVISDLSRRLNSEVRVSTDMARVEISAVIMDSRRIVEGSLFACVVGEHFDGHNFAQEAVDRGATALLVDRELPIATPQIIVDDVRSALGEVAALVSGRPSDAMKVIGVTGTNGKTTVAQMLAAVFNADGQKSAVIGTLEGDMTTPEAPVLQRKLRELCEDGVSVVAMEVSSHSLVQQRVQGTAFAAAVFTNLGRDHLDLHGTQEEYFRAKSLLFTSHGVKQMIINGDDVHGRLLGDLSSDIGDVYRFSMSDMKSSDGVEQLCIRSRRNLIPCSPSAAKTLEERLCGDCVCTCSWRNRRRHCRWARVCADGSRPNGVDRS